MAKKKAKDSERRKTDPRLKSFLRKAAAIIAAEKGLNTESRVKLQTLANHNKLPPELFEEAINQLQQNSDSSTNFTHYEKAFVKFLDGELEQVSGGILSPGAVNEAIALAKLKYEINGTRAQQLINARATAAGIELISSLEAEAFASQAIADRVGTAVSIDDDLRQQLHGLGKKWGLDESRVDQAVSRQTSRNRSSKRQSVVRPFVVSAVILFALTSAFGIAYTNGWIPSGWLQSSSRRPNPIEPNTSATESSRFPTAILADLAYAKKQSSRLDSIFEKIQSESPAQHRLGYQELVRQACSTRGPVRNSLFELVCRLYYVDPNESAQEIAHTLQGMLEAVQKEKPNVQNLKDVFVANELVGKLLVFEKNVPSASTERRQRIQQVAKASFDIPQLDVLHSDTPSIEFQTKLEYQQVTEPLIATEQWSRLIQIAWKDPQHASILLQPLYDLTKSKLPSDAIAVNRDDIVSTIMKTDHSRWRIFKNQILSSIESCDETRLIEWVSIAESSNDPEFQTTIGKSLLPRLGIQPKSQRHRDIISAIESFGLQYRNRILRPVISRNELLENYIRNTVELETGEAFDQSSPDRIAQLALAVNVELAFCAAIEDASFIDDSSFIEFDRLIAIPSPRLRELISLPIDRRNAKSTGETGATASDRRRLNSSLDRLRDLSPESSGLRVLALKQLTQIAHRFEGISYADAELLAEFLLSDLGREELLNVEQLVDSFSHWPNLLLAIADKIPESNVSSDQALTIARLLSNQSLELATQQAWKQALQFDLMTTVTNKIENQVDMDPNNLKSNWIRLKIYLIELYKERLALELDRTYVDESFSSPHQVTKRHIESTIQQVIDRGRQVDEQIAGAKRAMLLINWSNNEVAATAFANQLLIQIIAADISQFDREEEANIVLSNLNRKLEDQPLASDQLYATELALLRIVDIKRKSLVQRLLKKDK